jgi:hypothetical protein
MASRNFTTEALAASAPAVPVVADEHPRRGSTVIDRLHAANRQANLRGATRQGP